MYYIKGRSLHFQGENGSESRIYGKLKFYESVLKNKVKSLKAINTHIHEASHLVFPACVFLKAIKNGENRKENRQNLLKIGQGNKLFI